MTLNGALSISESELPTAPAVSSVLTERALTTFSTVTNRAVTVLLTRLAALDKLSTDDQLLLAQTHGDMQRLHDLLHTPDAAAQLAAAQGQVQALDANQDALAHAAVAALHTLNEYQRQSPRTVPLPPALLLDRAALTEWATLTETLLEHLDEQASRLRRQLALLGG